jgi:hypothetical protein
MDGGEKEMNEENVKVYEGSGNVFADLGLKDAEELYIRAKIGFQVLTGVNPFFRTPKKATAHVRFL